MLPDNYQDSVNENENSESYDFIPDDEEPIDAEEGYEDVEEEDDEPAEKKKISVWTILMVVIAIVLLAIIGYIAYKAYDYYHIPAYETGEIEDVEDEPLPTQAPVVLDNSDKTDMPQATEKPAYSKNTVAYLTVPGVDVTDEPILRHPTDDNYYLTHNEFDQESIWGAYFIPSAWTMDNVDSMYRVTVIFGHSNGNSLHKKFSVLKNFKDVNFAKEHRYIYLTIGEQQTRWKIFAIADYPIDPSYTIANPDDSYFLTEIESMKAYSYNKYNVDVGLSDKVLILSTCTGSDHYETRFIVCAKLDGVF